MHNFRAHIWYQSKYNVFMLICYTVIQSRPIADCITSSTGGCISVDILTTQLFNYTRTLLFHSVTITKTLATHRTKNRQKLINVTTNTGRQMKC